MTGLFPVATVESFQQPAFVVDSDGAVIANDQCRRLAGIATGTLDDIRARSDGESGHLWTVSRLSSTTGGGEYSTSDWATVEATCGVSSRRSPRRTGR